MLQCKILCVGKLKEKFYTAACAEYEKRLSRLLKLQIIEVMDEPAPQSLRQADIERIKTVEGEKLLRKTTLDEYVIALSLEGRCFSSEGWAEELQRLMNQGKSKLSLVIGGSHGLGENILMRANDTLSFSQFTFGHQLMRVILLEQLYRSMKILHNEAYHK